VNLKCHPVSNVPISGIVSKLVIEDTRYFLEEDFITLIDRFDHATLVGFLELGHD